MNIRAYFNKNFSDSESLLLTSGRSALQAAIEDLHLKNSKIALPSFICSDIFSQLFIQNNIEPILIDSPKREFNITFKEIKKVLSKNKGIKALIVVHCFGVANKDIEIIKKLCIEKNIKLIEDCAHCFNQKFDKRFIGLFGDVSIFSFPKTLGFSSGGAYVKNKGHVKISIKSYKLSLLELSRFLKSNFKNSKILRALGKFRRKKGIDLDPKTINVEALNYFVRSQRVPMEKTNLIKRGKTAKLFHSLLKQNLSSKNLPKLETENNFFQSIPILVNNREKIFSELIKNKIDVRKMWSQTLSQDNELKQKWRLKKTPNAENYSQKIINIIINPLFNSKRIKKNTETISEIINKYD